MNSTLTLLPAEPFKFTLLSGLPITLQRKPSALMREALNSPDFYEESTSFLAYFDSDNGPAICGCACGALMFEAGISVDEYVLHNRGATDIVTHDILGVSGYSYIEFGLDPLYDTPEWYSIGDWLSHNHYNGYTIRELIAEMEKVGL